VPAAPLVLAVAPVLAVTLVLAGCSDGDTGRNETGRNETGRDETGSPTITATPSEPRTDGTGPELVETISTGLRVPWGLAFLPDGAAIVTERDSGRVLEIRGRAVREIGRLDDVAATGEAGLLGVEVSPDYVSDHRLYFYLTTAEDNRVVSAEYTGRRLGPARAVLTGIPNGQIHDGGRLEFGPDGFLYVSTGETGNGDLAPDRGSLGGKILRITKDGEPAPGNPDPDSPVWTWGHRNVQGLALDDEGRLWASEFGANTFDELNLVEKGHNYGWPEVEGNGDVKGLTDPQVVWRTAEASPSGLAFRDGVLWMASLRGERLWRVTVVDGRAEKPDDFFVGAYGRLRTVVVAPDGNLWVTTSNQDGRGTPTAEDDRILVIRPS
jgi:glucose/arabinose dehydrogenase